MNQLVLYTWLIRNSASLFIFVKCTGPSQKIVETLKHFEEICTSQSRSEYQTFKYRTFWNPDFEWSGFVGMVSLMPQKWHSVCFLCFSKCWVFSIGIKHNVRDHNIPMETTMLGSILELYLKITWVWKIATNLLICFSDLFESVYLFSGHLK